MRLEVENLKNFAKEVAGFYSKLVRLEAEQGASETTNITFLFQTGAIRRVRRAAFCRAYKVSIPNWCD